MRIEDAKHEIESGKAVLGIEFGSTRIKGVLIGSDFTPIAEGSYEWENKLRDGYWTYSMDDVTAGLQSCVRSLKHDVKEKYGITLKSFAAMGVSAMMHGYLAFDQNDRLMVPFRTWRNTTTAQASRELTRLFHYNIPQRWSISHVYQAILNEEEHVSSIHSINTLAGYVHYLLCGKRVLGIGDASGMFPIDVTTKTYDPEMIRAFGELIKDRVSWKIEDILPQILLAGQEAGVLSEKGALLLDPDGDLQPGAVMAPPEGDAGTGMTATNSVRQRTGNVSAGTSIFGMVVLEKELDNVYEEIDLVTTPDGSLTGMAHCNNCSSDLNAWVKLLEEFARAAGSDISRGDIYTALFNEALKGDADCGGVVNYNYISGEPITKCDEGRPLLTRMPEARFTLANFMRAQIYSAFAALKIGMDLLTVNEGVKIDCMYGHGGLFKTPGVAQKFLAGALNTDVSVNETAGEGGPWGMAILARYALDRPAQSLPDYLDEVVFRDTQGETCHPDEKDVEGFAAFMRLYRNTLEAEKAATEGMRS